MPRNSSLFISMARGDKYLPEFYRKWSKLGVEDCTERLSHIFSAKRDMSNWENGHFEIIRNQNSKHPHYFEVERDTRGDTYIEKMFNNNSDYDTVRIYDKDGRLTSYYYTKEAYHPFDSNDPGKSGTVGKKYIMEISKNSFGRIIKKYVCRNTQMNM